MKVTHALLLRLLFRCKTSTPEFQYVTRRAIERFVERRQRRGAVGEVQVVYTHTGIHSLLIRRSFPCANAVLPRTVNIYLKAHCCALRRDKKVDRGLTH